jgi:Thiamine pyrophosphate enzyme, C-terminal TPP binding domain
MAATAPDAFVGDGASSMLMAELATYVKYGLPVKVVVVENDTLGQIKWKQTFRRVWSGPRAGAGNGRSGTGSGGGGSAGAALRREPRWIRPPARPGRARIGRRSPERCSRTSSASSSEIEMA